MFLVEGNKTIKEIPNSHYKIHDIYSVAPTELSVGNLITTEISEADLKKISFLQHPKDSVAVCELKEEFMERETGVQLILDGIQDPGNLGTIIRLADWFGISQIICSEDTADFYNPKVIQASMGSFLRVKIVYTDLENYIPTNTNLIIGTDMAGTDFYDFEFPEKFNLVLGNEGNGIRPEIENLLTDKITIPRFGKSQATESLNVAMSAGIILGQIFNKK
ncbi:Putative TrmH family tRNA/rRNA methyltransferase [Kaistella antarctica]|uniref:TrmH family tRNA/rRNA methyltransferase n=1 Tax=Kaistella antarctica TaxID=266748 RepID=A0A3S4UW82_9FLAO|nr:Putative TrmH family tRNA/rRNA methyltransferase [Kaistella antarctica]